MRVCTYSTYSTPQVHLAGVHYVITFPHNKVWTHVAPHKVWVGEHSIQATMPTRHLSSHLAQSDFENPKKICLQ